MTRKVVFLGRTVEKIHKISAQCAADCSAIPGHYSAGLKDDVYIITTLFLYVRSVVVRSERRRLYYHTQLFPWESNASFHSDGSELIDLGSK